MRTKLFASLLIISFVFASFPLVQAQEAPEPVPQPEIAEPEVVETQPETKPEPVVEPVDIPVEPEPDSEEPGIPTEPMAVEPLLEEATMMVMSASELQLIEEAPSVSLLIRYGENIAWSGTVPLPQSGTVPIAPTGESTSIDVASDSLLAVLLGVDGESSAFEVTDLDYYPMYGSFLINCINATNFANSCGEWQYVVNGQYSFVGTDDFILHDGDEVFIYFGSPRRVTLTDTELAVNETFIATAQSYDPATNEYNPLAGYTVGVTQPNPAVPWMPFEIATSTSGVDGTASFSLTVEGAYGLGLQTDGYFPSVSFTVSSSTGSGSGDGGTASSFDFAAAYDFLESGQQDDGSWDTPITTDWTAMALGISGAPSSMRSNLASYLREEEPDLDTALDYERHAMALMALGINPYTGGPRDFISPIVDKYDGTQMDEPGLVNDDAFGIIVLMNAGYTKDDEIIKDLAAYVVSKQKSDGSWTGGVDVSGAYIQALKLVSSLPNVSSAINQAETYMRSQQNPDGGFGSPSDAFATSWALQGIEALGASPDSWKKRDNSPLTYLINHQDEDGGMEIGKDSYDDRAWATAYAIPAAKGLTWAEILKNFKKTEAESADDNGNVENDTATTTDEVAVLSAQEPLINAYSATSTDATIDDTQTVAEIIAPKLMVLQEDPQEPQTPTENPASDLTAAALDTGAWEHIKGLFSSFWSFLKNLFN